MAAMNPPHSQAVVNVRKEDVDRYREQGWTEVQSAKAPTKKRSTSSKSSE